MTKRRGQPTLYSPEVAREICERIATTPRGLAFILRENPHLPRISTVLLWLSQDDKKDFLDSYVRAREAQADLIFDECLEIADDSSADGERGDNGKETQHATEQVARSKLRVDTRLRMAGKLAPKKYGDKFEMDVKTEFKDVTDKPDPEQKAHMALAGVAAENGLVIRNLKVIGPAE